MRNLVVSYLMVSLAAALGCGDDGQQTTPIAGTGGQAGFGGTFVAGGAGASAGTGGGAAGMAAPPPIPCGSAMCYAPANPLAALTGGAMLPVALPMPVACCFDGASSQCGVSMSGATCEAPATADTRCPGIDLQALGGLAGGLPIGNVMTGCCTAAGMCGLDGALFGRGCVENGEAKSMLGMVPLIGTLLPIPAPIACDHPPIDTDAGI